MTRELEGVAAAVGVLAAISVLTAATSSEPFSDRGPGNVRSDTAQLLLSGIVLDSERRPVASAEVVFVPGGGPSGTSSRPAAAGDPSAVTTSTDSSGRFSLRAPASSGGQVRLVSDGAGRWDFGVDAAADSDLHLDVVLPPAGEGGTWPVTVDVEARPAALRGSGFYRRRAERDGFFAGPEELREAARDGGLADVLSTARGMVRTSGCPEPAEYVDGRRLSERVTGPNRLELLALEAYRRGDPPPPSFERRADCGVLLLWTGPATSSGKRDAGRHR